MLRYRRYRGFIVFAIVTVFVIYEFGTDGSWRGTPAALPDTEGALPVGDGDSAPKWAPKPQVAQETKKLEIDIPAAKTSLVLVAPPAVAPVKKPEQTKPPPLPTTNESPWGKAGPENDGPLPESGDGVVAEQGVGRIEVEPIPTTATAVRWTSLTQHFPVPSEATIPLPSGSPKSIPRDTAQVHQDGDGGGKAGPAGQGCRRSRTSL